MRCGDKMVTGNAYYMVTPGKIVCPAEYYLCQKHRNMPVSFEEVYNEDGTRKPPLKD